uniref:Reverse transcriptase domain-containing protein n=1 Tax=Strongyloides venezuelensis TaxID=75913 RepID=A0A0K0FS46_STRVS
MHPDTVPPAIDYITKEIAANRMEEVRFPKMASPGVLVTKKDQSLRLCLSAERINHNFIHIPLNLPNLNDIQSLISNTSISWKFTTLDMKSAYRLIGLDDQSSEFTTVSLPFGYFKSKCLVYGIAQNGILFYNTIKNLLKDVPRCTIYMDDILIVTPEHDSSPIFQTLQILQQNRLKINIHKSFFLQDSVMYLSYNVSNEGIRMNTEVANQLAKMEKPTTTTDLRSLKGKISYLRNFIGPCAAIYDKELGDMSEGVWSPKKNATLKKVQTAIREAKILNFFNPSTESLSLQTWSEKEILAGILWGKNITTNEYSLLNTFSRVMVKSEQNYPFIEKQALAAKEAFFYFEAFTRIHFTTLEIPDKTLVHMLKKRNVCANAQYSRILRWSLEMEEFPHDVVYRDLHEKVFQMLNLSNHVKTTRIQSILKSKIMDTTKSFNRHRIPTTSTSRSLWRYQEPEVTIPTKTSSILESTHYTRWGLICIGETGPSKVCLSRCH